MRPGRFISRFCAGLILSSVLAPALRAAEPGCGQALVDGTAPPTTTAFIYPRAPAQPFYQWENNDGYCGEVSLMQAGLANGQWMSQLNARLVCGTGLSQSGRNGACAMHARTPDYNAQLLIESPGTGVTGPKTYANAAQCVANSRLTGATFPYEAQMTGVTGYEGYMSWVKAQVIAGNQVTMGVLLNGGSDPQYDHEVTVLRIGTNHAPTDASYYPDDVLYFDDHGVYTFSGKNFAANPAIPPGAGADDKGCTPYVFGYSFASLAQTRAAANKSAAQGYSIIIPAARSIATATGGSGYDTVPVSGPHNYAFSISGPADESAETLPVSLEVVGPTYTHGDANPADPVAGYNYENPMIGKDLLGRGCTNGKPEPMSHLTLRATVSGLKQGTRYNLYDYVLGSLDGIGAAAGLAAPVSDFNAHAAMATHVTTFTATGPTYRHSVTTTSDKIVVFRCVAADAP